tara:strand:- start:191 stop:562 length:372 start_codon:yes stop_codon:yes gene_type:complete
MREIKFRVWNRHNEKFRYFDLFEINKGLLCSIDEEDDIPQQYTGLKDKNEVEIYEGDIIIFDNSDIGGQRYKGIVEWNTDPTLDGLCFGLFIPPKFEGRSGWFGEFVLGELEVVGNIFEGVDK